MAMDISSGDTGASPDEVTPLAELTAAIKQVRTDGINKPGLRVPEPLSRALGIDSNPQAAVSRVRQALLSCAVQLERTRRLAFLFGAGFREDIWGSSGQRVARTAKALGLSRRNTYLQIHRASEAMAAQLLRLGPASHLSGIDFTTLRTDCIVDYQDSSPRLHLTRTIMALGDDLNGIEEYLHFPNSPEQEPECYPLEGGEIRNSEYSNGSLSVNFDFSEHLHVGTSHTFSFGVRIPHRDALAPLLILSPVNPRQTTRIELRFGSDLPRILERIERAWPSQITSPEYQGEAINFDTSPVVVEFEDMEQGWDYGVRWSW